MGLGTRWNLGLGFSHSGTCKCEPAGVRLGPGPILTHWLVGSNHRVAGCGTVDYSPRTGFHQLVGRDIAQGLSFGALQVLELVLVCWWGGSRSWVLCCMVLCLGRLG